MNDEAMKIVEQLAATDPVYGPVRGPQKLNPDGTPKVWATTGKPIYTFIRICALCRVQSGDNEENVTHEATCPWIPAKRLMRGLTP